MCLENFRHKEKRHSSYQQVGYLSSPFVFWADHLVDIPCEKTLIEVIQFVMYDKLLFWMEVMSISGRVYEATLILKRTLAWLELKVCCSFVCYGTYPMLTGSIGLASLSGVA